MANFLDLPPELRSVIYHAYVAVDGGYICDTNGFIEGKLKQADGKPICIALLFTCRLVAREMHGLALRVNTITFSTLSGNPGLRDLASKFDFLLHCVNNLRQKLVAKMGKYITKEAYDELRDMYPQFTPLLDALRARGSLPPLARGPYGEAPSVFRRFIQDVLDVTYSFDKRAIREIGVYSPSIGHCVSGMHALCIARCSIDPWIIPSRYDMQQLQLMVLNDADCEPTMSRHDGSEWRFSAAAAAIYFVQSLPDTIRRHLRRLVLLEDREALAYPESYGYGLIPLCKENPLLHVERRVNLWRNVFQPGLLKETPRQRYQLREESTQPGMESLNSCVVTRNVASWIVEAHELVPAGMPASSYSLLLDGDPVPQLTSRIFQSIVQRDVAWQEAWTMSVDQGRIPGLTSVSRRSWEGDCRVCYFFEALPQAMKDMASGNSIVRCNFDAGEPMDAEKLRIEHHHWNEDNWTRKWREHDPLFWNTEPPLPSWMDLLKENFHHFTIRPGNRTHGEWRRFFGQWC
ncbi:C6 transcription factor [Colletotrichum higginsianum]|nr:C6 transcription factor [Colletotrichum higginsianum]